MKFIELFKTVQPSHGKFLARVFGIFNEEIVRIWCRDSRAPYKDLGRPTLRRKSETRGHALDFSFQDLKNGLIYIVEMKCWLEYQNYKYLSLTAPSFLDCFEGDPAFDKFLEVSKGNGICQVFIDSESVCISGGILIWGSVSESGRSALMKERRLHDVLSLENIISNLASWQNQEYKDFLNARASRMNELIKGLS